jgi:hypothetical protein
MYAVYIQYMYSMYAIYIQYICSIYSVYIQYKCSIYTVYMQYIYNIYAVYIQYICSIYAVYIQYIYSNQSPVFKELNLSSVNKFIRKIKDKQKFLHAAQFRSSIQKSNLRSSQSHIFNSQQFSPFLTKTAACSSHIPIKDKSSECVWFN